MAKHVVRLAKLAKSEAEKEEFVKVSPNGDGVFRIAKQMNCTNQDVVGILNLYKSKGEALDHGNYHGLKLAGQVVELLER